jgi:hypothetical protein
VLFRSGDGRRIRRDVTHGLGLGGFPRRIDPVARAIALEASPEFSIGEFEATLKFRNKQDKDLFLEGLLKAGFPP